MWLLGTFAGVALLLATAGIYGVLSFVVTQRNREIGIRMAMGARQQSVIRLMMRRSLKLVALGCGVGLLGALLSTRLLQHLLFEVSPSDPTTLVVVVVVIGRRRARRQLRAGAPCKPGRPDEGAEGGVGWGGET